LEQISGQTLSNSVNKTTDEVGVYNEIETYGSNQQWGGGFMFGERPTYKELRKAVQEKNDNPIDNDFEVQPQQSNEVDAQLEDALRRSEDTRVVIGTPSEGGTKLTIKGEAIDKPVSTVSKFQEGNMSDDALFDAKELEQSLIQDELDFDSGDLYPQLTIFWDEVIEQDSEKKAKFAKNGIGTYDRMIKFFNEESEKGMYPATAEMTSQEVFMEEIKCIL
jgi:hypothetical protein